MQALLRSMRVGILTSYSLVPQNTGFFCDQSVLSVSMVGVVLCHCFNNQILCAFFSLLLLGLTFSNSPKITLTKNGFVIAKWG